MSQIDCRNVALGHEGRVVAQGLHFTVERGDCLCIVGENGSGKSTLLRTILGLLPPLSGKIVLDKNLRGQIGYLPQRTDVQRDFPASVSEVVLSGALSRCGLRPYYTEAERRLAREHMERLGIIHLARRSFRELSGGQQQRALLARALCAARSVLLLDEPVTGLDPVAAEELYDLIGNLNAQGMTVVMATHDLAGALPHANTVLHLGDTQRFFGSRADYLASPVGHSFLDRIGGDGHA